MLNSLAMSLTGLLAPYLGQISLLLVATLMVIYGDLLNKQVKAVLMPYHFLLRTIGFVLACAFGYGALLIWLAPLLSKVFLLLPELYRGSVIVVSFFCLGWLADKRRYI